MKTIDLKIPGRQPVNVQLVVGPGTRRPRTARYRLRFTVMLALLLLLVGGPSWNVAEVKADEPEWAAVAVELEARRDWPELHKHAFRWTRVRPGDYRAWFSLGQAREQLGLADQAMGSYRQALRLNKQLTAAWFHLGVLLREKGDYEEAIEVNRRALALEPALTAARYNLGVLYERTGQIDQALAAYRQITEEDPQFAPAWHNLGAILGNRGRLTEASSAFEQATSLNPRHKESWLALATAHLAADRREESERALARLEQLDPAMAAAFRRKHLSP